MNKEIMSVLKEFVKDISKDRSEGVKKAEEMKEMNEVVEITNAIAGFSGMSVFSDFRHKIVMLLSGRELDEAEEFFLSMFGLEARPLSRHEPMRYEMIIQKKDDEKETKDED